MRNTDLKESSWNIFGPDVPWQSMQKWCTYICEYVWLIVSYKKIELVV